MKKNRNQSQNFILNQTGGLTHVPSPPKYPGDDLREDVFRQSRQMDHVRLVSQQEVSNMIDKAKVLIDHPLEETNDRQSHMPLISRGVDTCRHKHNIIRNSYFTNESQSIGRNAHTGMSLTSPHPQTPGERTNNTALYRRLPKVAAGVMQSSQTTADGTTNRDVQDKTNYNQNADIVVQYNNYEEEGSRFEPNRSVTPINFNNQRNPFQPHGRSKMAESVTLNTFGAGLPKTNYQTRMSPLSNTQQVAPVRSSHQQPEDEVLQASDMSTSQRNWKAFSAMSLNQQRFKEKRLRQHRAIQESLSGQQMVKAKPRQPMAVTQQSETGRLDSASAMLSKEAIHAVRSVNSIARPRLRDNPRSKNDLHFLKPKPIKSIMNYTEQVNLVTNSMEHNDSNYYELAQKNLERLSQAVFDSRAVERNSVGPPSKFRPSYSPMARKKRVMLQFGSQQAAQQQRLDQARALAESKRAEVDKLRHERETAIENRIQDDNLTAERTDWKAALTRKTGSRGTRDPEMQDKLDQMAQELEDLKVHWQQEQAIAKKHKIAEKYLIPESLIEKNLATAQEKLVKVAKRRTSLKSYHSRESAEQDEQVTIGDLSAEKRSISPRKRATDLSPIKQKSSLINLTKTQRAKKETLSQAQSSPQSEGSSVSCVDTDGLEELIQTTQAQKKNAVDGKLSKAQLEDLQEAFLQWYDSHKVQRVDEYYRNAKKEERLALRRFVNEEQLAINKILLQGKVDANRPPTTMLHEHGVDICVAGRGIRDERLVTLQIDTKKSISPHKKNIKTKALLRTDLLEVDGQTASADLDSQAPISETGTEILTKAGHKGNFYSNLRQAGNKQVLSDEMQQAANFQRVCLQKGVIGLPAFAKIRKNQLNLIGYKLNEGLMQALSEFIGIQATSYLKQLEEVKAQNQMNQRKSHIDGSEKHLKVTSIGIVTTVEYCSFLVHDLVLEDNGLKDASFAKLLSIMSIQAYQYQMLRSLTYKNNEIGPMSVAALNQIQEMCTNGSQIKFESIKLDSVKVTSNQTLVNLLHLVLAEMPTLRILELKHIQLNHPKVVEELLNLLKAQTSLEVLDLSATNLQPQQIVEVTQVICINSQNLRSLDLSENKVEVRYKESHNTFVNLIIQLLMCQTSFSTEDLEDEDRSGSFVCENDVLQHLNFSGMALGKAAITRIAKILKWATLDDKMSLLSVHFARNLLSSSDLLHVIEDTLSVPAALIYTSDHVSEGIYANYPYVETSEHDMREYVLRNTLAKKKKAQELEAKEMEVEDSERMCPSPSLDRNFLQSTSTFRGIDSQYEKDFPYPIHKVINAELCSHTLASQQGISRQMKTKLSATVGLEDDLFVLRRYPGGHPNMSSGSIRVPEMLNQPLQWRASMHQKELCHVCMKSVFVILFFRRPRKERKDTAFYTKLVDGINCESAVIDSLEQQYRAFAPEKLSEHDRAPQIFGSFAGCGKVQSMVKGQDFFQSLDQEVNRHRRLKKARAGHLGSNQSLSSSNQRGASPLASINSRDGLNSGAASPDLDETRQISKDHHKKMNQAQCHHLLMSYRRAAVMFNYVDDCFFQDPETPGLPPSTDQSKMSPGLSPLKATPDLPKDNHDNPLTDNRMFVFVGFLPPGKHCILVRDDHFAEKNNGRAQFYFKEVLIEPRPKEIITLS